jgi:hypothetical protein
VDRAVTVLLLLTLAAALGACGAARVEPPDPARPFTTGGLADREFPAAGISFRAPADWPFNPGQAPLVTSTTSGTATIAIWRYPRTEPRPEGDAALQSAEQALIDAARTRDPSFRDESAERVRVDGAPGIELVGTQRVAGRERRVRSTHVYAKQVEVVIDAYAAPRDFETVDREIFRPLVASLKIDPPGA